MVAMAEADGAVVGIGNLGLGIPSSESETRTADRGGSNAMDHPKEVVEMDGLPEGCVAHIISLTTPRDAARCSAISRGFHSASDSDAVWRKFLPPDLDLIVSTLPPPPPPLGPPLTRTKDAFLRLCSDPLLIDSGRKEPLKMRWRVRKRWCRPAATTVRSLVGSVLPFMAFIGVSTLTIREVSRPTPHPRPQTTGDIVRVRYEGGSG